MGGGNFFTACDADYLLFAVFHNSEWRFYLVDTSELPEKLFEKKSINCTVQNFHAKYLDYYEPDIQAALEALV